MSNLINYLLLLEMMEGSSDELPDTLSEHSDDMSDGSELTVSN